MIRLGLEGRPFELLSALTDTLWEKGQHQEAEDALLRATELAAPNARLEKILFRHAQRLRTITKDYPRAIDWYLYIADHYPQGYLSAHAMDSATACITQLGIHNRERYVRRINDFLHPDGLKR